MAARPFIARLGLVAALAGSSSSLALAVGTDVDASNRTGFYLSGSDLVVVASAGGASAGLVVANTTASTSSSTGALRVNGGLGVLGSIYAGVDISAAHGVTDSEGFGAGISIDAPSQRSLVVGSAGSASASPDAVAIGYASGVSSSTEGIAVGRSASVNTSPGSIVIGAGASSNSGSGYNVLIGWTAFAGASTTQVVGLGSLVAFASGVSNSIGLGAWSTTISASNLLQVGRSHPTLGNVTSIQFNDASQTITWLNTPDAAGSFGVLNAGSLLSLGGIASRKKMLAQGAVESASSVTGASLRAVDNYSWSGISADVTATLATNALTFDSGAVTTTATLKAKTVIVATLSSAGVLTVNPSTVSTSSTTGALVVNGGVGVVGSLYLGDRTGTATTYAGFDTNGRVIDTGISSVSAPITGTGAAGQVSYWNGTTTQTGSTKFTWVDATPSLVINGTGGTLPAQMAGGAGIQVGVGSGNAGVTRVLLDVFMGTGGGFSTYAGRAARGTVGAPSALQAGDHITSISAWGYGATAYSATSMGRFAISAGENWTDTAQGTYASILTTPSGGVAMAETVRVWGNGGVTISTTFTTSPGAGAVTATTPTNSLDIQSVRSVAASAAAGTSCVALGLDVAIPSTSTTLTAVGTNITVTGTASSATGTVAVGSGITLTESAGGRQAIFGASIGAGSGAAGMLVLGINRSGILGNNGIAVVNGGASTVNLQSGILIGSASGQVGNFGASRVVGLGFSLTLSANDAMGFGFGANSTFSKAVALGRNATTTAANQLRIGGTVAATDHLDVSLTSTTASTSTTTGSIVTPGGIGVAGTVNANILASADGLVSAPGFTFTSELTSGLFRQAAGAVSLTLSGVEYARFKVSSGFIQPSVLNINAPTIGTDIVLTGPGTSPFRVSLVNGGNTQSATIYGTVSLNTNGAACNALYGYATNTSGDGSLFGVTGSAAWTTGGGTGLSRAVGGQFIATTAATLAGKTSYGIITSATATGATNASSLVGVDITAAGAASSASVLGTNFAVTAPAAFTGTTLEGLVGSVVMAGGTASTTASTVRALDLSLTVNQGAALGYTGMLLNVIETATGTGTKNLLDLQVGGTSRFTVDNTGTVKVLSSTASTNTTTGALIVTGGVGIGGNLNVGGTLTIPTLSISSTSTITSGTIVLQNILLTANPASPSTAQFIAQNAAVVVGNGATTNITGNCIGYSIGANNSRTSATITTLRGVDIDVNAAIASGTTTNAEGLKITVRNDTAGHTFTNATALLIPAIGSTGTITNRVAINQVGANDKVIFNGQTSLLSTTAATSTITGALTVAGGAGVAGALYVGGITVTTASTTGSAGLRVLPGVAPTTPVDGDIWGTSVGLFAQINSIASGLLRVPVQTLASAATVTLNFFTGQGLGVLNGLATGCTFSTSALQPGCIYGLRLKDDGTARALTWPASWTWLTAPPTTTTAGKWMVVTLESLSTTDANVLADWKNQP